MPDELRSLIEAHGGLDYWRSLESIEIEVSASGLLFTTKRVPKMDHARLSISIKRPEVTIHEYPAPGQDTKFYGEGLVEILNAHGGILHAREYPRQHFRSVRRLFYWDDLDFAYFCGYAMWNYLTMPFLLAQPGVAVKKSGGTALDGLTKLAVRFPENFPTHCANQEFYFDQQWHLQRHDYTAEVVGTWAKAAHFCEGYKQFSGLCLPTKRRVYPRLLCNRPFRGITLVAIDIHDLAVRVSS